MQTVILLISALLSPGQASAATLPEGRFQMASARACSTSDTYEDPFFARFVTSFSWELEAGTITERISMYDPEKDFKCEAELEYKTTELPREEGPLPFLPRLRLEQSGFRSSCLRQGVRPTTIELHYLAYPDFLEIYEPVTDPGNAPCPLGTHIITQFKRVSP